MRGPRARRSGGEPRGCAGQATVELVGLLPLLLAVGFAVFSVLAAGSAREAARQSASAGAVALMQDREPRAAARAALPRWARDRSRVAIRGRRISVSVRPNTPLDALNTRLTGRAEAEAGPPSGVER
jgi:hypothetical protein